MNNSTLLSFDIINQSQHTDLGIEAWLDDNCFFDNTIDQGTVHASTNFLDNEGSHKLIFKLKNKKEFQTTVDDQNNIIDDALIDIRNVTIEGIDIDLLLYNIAVYTHDTNGTSDFAEHKFFGTLGCNGTVEFNFTTPFYIWLLENM